MKHNVYKLKNTTLLEPTDMLLKEVDKEIDDILWGDAGLDDKHLAMLLRTRESLQKSLDNGQIYTPTFCRG